jgi:hypothetical protein
VGGIVDFALVFRRSHTRSIRSSTAIESIIVDASAGADVRRSLRFADEDQR